MGSSLGVQREPCLWVRLVPSLIVSVISSVSVQVTEDRWVDGSLLSIKQLWLTWNVEQNFD